MYNIIIKWLLFCITFFTKTDLDLLKTIRILPNFLSKESTLKVKCFLEFVEWSWNLSFKSSQNSFSRL